MQQRVVYFLMGIVVLSLIGSIPGRLFQQGLISLLIILVVLFLIWCAIEERNKFDLNRLASVKAQEIYLKSENEFEIKEEKEFDIIRAAFDNIKWEPDTTVEIRGERKVEATFFYSNEENKAELFSVYEIYLMKNGNLFFQSEKEEEGCGKLNKEHADNVKSLFF